MNSFPPLGQVGLAQMPISPNLRFWALRCFRCTHTTFIHPIQYQQLQVGLSPCRKLFVIKTAIELWLKCLQIEEVLSTIVTTAYSFVCWTVQFYQPPLHGPYFYH